MRFIADGPSIPDDLLLARDQGRVIFFCGAGVSRARANLPDFFGLAKKVVGTLGVAEDSPVCKLISEAYAIESRTGIPGVISADRIFGILEREFDQQDIQSAVASALRPTDACDASAHMILLDLATTADGAVQLVTTNFDRLFEDDNRDLRIWQPPRLPSPAHSAEMNGLVYLHGRATQNYDGAEESGFVLSSSEFGRAYLSEGWATTFVREILQRYVVVFVGYSADDPPLQYLLEALNKTTSRPGNAYAFQAGGPNDAAARWLHKGVEAISYSPENGHSALWETLNCWAKRARDTEQWYQQTIAQARKGPTALAPFERGQIAHVISTVEGMKRFSDADNPPPAEWLCVFDSHRRFAKPGYTEDFFDRGEYVDPFDLYGLDIDLAPEKIAPDDYSIKRDIPNGAWDGLTLNRLDRNSVDDTNFSAIRGHWAENPPRVVPRLEQLCVWLGKVANQPAAIWWATHQQTLHADLRRQIKWELEKSDVNSDAEVRRAWSFLFEVWDQRYAEFERETYQFEADAAKFGWDKTMIRKYAQLRRPRFSIDTSYRSSSIPPSKETKLSAKDLVHRDVYYPEKHDKLVIPDACINATVIALRQNLELALSLENELGEVGLTDIPPIHVEAQAHEHHDLTYGLSSAVLEFASLFTRLKQLELCAAYLEYSSWTTTDPIFLQLRIWAAIDPSLSPDKEFSAMISSIDCQAFWDSRHQPDLLLTLASRWNGFSHSTRSAIEEKLLHGPSRWDNEEDDAYQKRKAWNILERIHWLSTKGCSLSFDLKEVSLPLQALVPEWTHDQAVKAVDSLSVQGGWVRTHEDPTALLHLPLSSILAKARALSGRTNDFLIENDPFAGLAVLRPRLAFLALANAAKSNEYPEWAWRKFLNSESRKNDNDRLIVVIAVRLAMLPDDTLLILLRQISQWILVVAGKLSELSHATFDSLFRKLVMFIRRHPSHSNSNIVRGKGAPDWVMEAINSPVGNLAQALFKDPRQKGLKQGKGFPPEWIRHVDSLLTLGGDARRYGLTLFAHNLSWFFFVSPTWTELALISVLEGTDEQDRDATLAGFLWGSRTPGLALYLRMKQLLLSYACEPRPDRKSHRDTLVGVILAGWGTIDEHTGQRCVSNDEMRSVLLSADDGFRIRVLWQIGNWTGNDANDMWTDLVPEFFSTVWPRQISIRSPEVSAQLLNLIFSNKNWFPTTARAVLPLLTKVTNNQHVTNLMEPPKDIVDQFPNETIGLLAATLSDNAVDWPYGVDATLRYINNVAGDEVSGDPRLINLNRIWGAR